MNKKKSEKSSVVIYKGAILSQNTKTDLLR